MTKKVEGKKRRGRRRKWAELQIKKREGEKNNEEAVLPTSQFWLAVVASLVGKAWIQLNGFRKFPLDTLLSDRYLTIIYIEDLSAWPCPRSEYHGKYTGRTTPSAPCRLAPFQLKIRKELPSGPNSRQAQRSGINIAKMMPHRTHDLTNSPPPVQDPKLHHRIKPHHLPPRRVQYRTRPI